jgi:glycosyltransferase involved in cell wall biosynthesis
LKVNLHVISAQTYCKFGSAYICQPTSQLVENIFKYSDVKTYFYSWHSTTFSSIAGSCDLALIPIPSNDFMMWEKPENKLIELWSIGLPVLTSPTPAYSRVMLKAGIDGTCKNVHEWQQKIIDLISSTEKRGDYMKLAANLVERDYSKEKIISQWDTLLNSISINPNTISTGPCIHEY